MGQGSIKGSFGSIEFTRILSFTIWLLTSMVLITGCDRQFGISGNAEKSMLLATNPVFPGSGDSNIKPGDSSVVPVQYECSIHGPENVGYTLKTSGDQLELKIVDNTSGAVMCDIVSAQIKKDLVDKKLLSLKACELSKLADTSKYKISIKDPSKSKSSNNGISNGVNEGLLIDGATDEDNFNDSINPIRNGADIKKWMASGDHSSKLFILYDATQFANRPLSFQIQSLPNQRRGLAGGEQSVRADPNFGDHSDNDTDSTSSPKDVCDHQSGDPLIIDLGTNSMPLIMSPITNGFNFDILGATSNPIPHAKKKISRVLNPRYMFLAKVGRTGRIFGIDDLFGDRTLGPDGHYASNGFAALAKYDSNRDGIIDSSDSIFSDLVVWNGAEGSNQKVFTLTEVGIKSIDLGYDPNYYEIDQYKNEIKFKSAVKFSDGTIRLIFDLWLRYL